MKKRQHPGVGDTHLSWWLVRPNQGRSVLFLLAVPNSKLGWSPGLAKNDVGWGGEGHEFQQSKALHTFRAKKKPLRADLLSGQAGRELAGFLTNCPHLERLDLAQPGPRVQKLWRRLPSVAGSRRMSTVLEHTEDAGHMHVIMVCSQPRSKVGLDMCRNSSLGLS